MEERILIDGQDKKELENLSFEIIEDEYSEDVTVGASFKGCGYSLIC